MVMSRSDEADFRAYVASRQGALRRAAFLMCGNWDHADDLVQVTLTKLFLAWNRVRTTQGPDAYAHRILANAVIDDRRRVRWRESVASAPEDIAFPADLHAQTVERLDLAAALNQLPARQRVTLVLRFWIDASVSQTAEILGCSPGTVKSQTADGLSKLRSLLNADLPVTVPEEKT
jgi:RNA polymerase sigma-70 factor (sigma-E family)